MKKIIVLIILLFSVFATANSQHNSDFKIKGFVDTYHALRIKSNRDWMSSRTRFRGELGKEFENSQLFVSFNANYNALLKNRTGFEMREAYLDHREKHWGIRLGRQLVIWGAADGVRITDLVSPMDMTEFLAQDYDDIRMPVSAMRFFLFNETMKFEAIFVPIFQSYILPVDAANPWSILPQNTPLPLLWDDSSTTPTFRLSNTEYGGRLCFNLHSIDFSFAALHTWNKMPVLKYEQSANKITIKPHYYRMGFIGGDFSKPLGQVVLRGEAAFNISKHFTHKQGNNHIPQKGFNTLNWLLGADWYASEDWIVMAQISSESIFGYKSYIAQPKHSSIATLSVSKKLLNSTLQLSDFTYFDLNYGSWFSRFSADYAISDQVRLIAGLDWFGGKGGIFGVYKCNSEVWIKAKYSF